jgi:hypothetical protein
MGNLHNLAIFVDSVLFVLISGKKDSEIANIRVKIVR